MIFAKKWVITLRNARQEKSDHDRLVNMANRKQPNTQGLTSGKTNIKPAVQFSEPGSK